jgi:hypothetical protein
LWPDLFKTVRFQHLIDFPDEARQVGDNVGDPMIFLPEKLGSGGRFGGFGEVVYGLDSMPDRHLLRGCHGVFLCRGNGLPRIAFLGTVALLKTVYPGRRI